MSLSLALTALLAPAEPQDRTMPPQTTVELRVTSVDEGEAKLLEGALERGLGDRLLEDGYRVVPVGAAADVRVWVHLDDAGARIETRGEALRSETVAGGDPQVVGLEIQQLTTALVDEVRPAQSSEAPPAVVLDLRGSAGVLELRERLQLGLLERGHALTRQPGPGDARLCVEAEAEGASVVVIAGDSSCDDSIGEVIEVPAVASAELQREHILDGASASLQRRAAELAEQQHAREVDAPPEPEPEPKRLAAPAEPPEQPDAPAPAQSDARISLSLCAHGGLLARSGRPDGVVGVSLRGGLRRGIGGALELGVVPSRAEGLRVVEYTPSAALDWRIGLRERGLVTLGAFGGVHLHSYTQSGPTGERGLRVGPTLGARTSVAFLARRGALLFATLHAGWSGGGWVHLLNGRETWRRSPVFVGLGLGGGWDFGLQSRKARQARR